MVLPRSKSGGPLLQQGPDILGHGLGGGIVANGQAQLAFRVVGVGGDTVVYGVGARRAARRRWYRASWRS